MSTEDDIVIAKYKVEASSMTKIFYGAYAALLTALPAFYFVFIRDFRNIFVLAPVLVLTALLLYIAIEKTTIKTARKLQNCEANKKLVSNASKKQDVNQQIDSKGRLYSFSFNAYIFFALTAFLSYFILANVSDATNFMLSFILPATVNVIMSSDF